MKIFSVFIMFWALLGTATASAERLAVTVPIANIRSGPGTSYEILWKVGKYHPVEVFEKSGSWYHFRDFEDDRGWLHKSLLGNIPTVITNVEKCNLRSGPGTNYDVLFSVEKGIPFKVIEDKNPWLQVEHADGDKGWIHASLVW